MEVWCNGNTTDFDSAVLGSIPNASTNSLLRESYYRRIYLSTNATMLALSSIQTELKAPKSQTNTFGGYKYRSCEDIMEAVKPLLHQYHAVLTVTDDIILVGERYYIKAVATFCSTEEGAVPISVSALARECASKKGYDESQITGSASSYARKVSLGGLLCVDDAKDADAVSRPRDKKSSTKTAENISPDLKAAQQSIVNLAKDLIKNGVSRNAVYDVISKNNDGNRMPNSIPTVELCKKIENKLNELR